MKMPLALTLLLLTGCGGAIGVGQARFADRPIVRHVDDRRPFSPAPDEIHFTMRTDEYRNLVIDPIHRGLGVPHPTRAKNVNALGEVPDSTWYENRRLTPAEVLAGPATHDPMQHKPWRVARLKTKGVAFGLWLEDAAGVQYLVKFDSPGKPELQTGAAIVGQRMMWALGYHVPHDDVVTFTLDELEVPEGLDLPELDGRVVPLTRERLAARLEPLMDADGRIRAVVSRALDGEPIGGWPDDGVRDDDPNDRIDHEHRRELRGMRVLLAWIGQTDYKANNRLDVFHPVDGEADDAGYVKHYMLDFDKALGVEAEAAKRPEDGYAYALDFSYVIRSLPALGLWLRPWERLDVPRDLIGVGYFEGERFTYDLFKPRLPEAPFAHRDRFDELWGVAKMLQLGEDHVKAAVDAADYTDPETQRYLVRTLMLRRARIAQDVLQHVTPFVDFSLRSRAGATDLCFEDLWSAHGFGPTARVTLRVFDDDGRQIGAPRARAPDAGCLELPALPTDYAIVRLDAAREAAAEGHIEVHLARSGGGPPRIVGIVREAD